ACSRYDHESAWTASPKPTLRLAIWRLTPLAKARAPFARRHALRIWTIVRPEQIWLSPARRAQRKLSAESGSKTASFFRVADDRKTEPGRSPQRSRPGP